MKNITLGIVAHVDSGKTTLSEAILYETGELKEYGRVDNGNCFLDNNQMERDRGITIFSKQAVFNVENTCFSLIDTPGHVDFSAEMERTLNVLDYGILVISATDGIKGHTHTLWRLLKTYNIPTFIFVNKMDQCDREKKEILAELKSELSEGCIDFMDNILDTNTIEEIVVASMESENSDILDYFLENNTIPDEYIRDSIKYRKVFPCYFGSALKLFGVKELIFGISNYAEEGSYSDDFGALVYKITKDKQGNRLTHMKITGGELSVKQPINTEEKVNQIRIYSGEKFTTINTAVAGQICTVTGLQTVKSGDGIGIEKGNNRKLLEPVLSYRLNPCDGVKSRNIYNDIKLLEDEFPELYVEWQENTEEINLKLMGPVQIEIIKGLIRDRYHINVDFDMGSITYKETIKSVSYGVGHFEPLRHYAEAVLKLEPGEIGSGLSFSTDCSEDILDKNWQRLIMTHLREKSHKGVLTGSDITDIHITVIGGKAHNKHTEGGDFRQATYRAVRNGLMYAESELLEPYYKFILIVPSDMIGKAMTDVEAMYGNISEHVIKGENVIIRGRAPVATLRNYQANVNAYTRGKGSISCEFDGYDICHNKVEVIDAFAYNPEEDVYNTAASVFCSHGSGEIIPWYQVREYMHCDIEDLKSNKNEDIGIFKPVSREKFDYSIGLEEIEQILSKTYKNNAGVDKREYKKKKALEYEYTRSVKLAKRPEKKLIIADGYNIIFAWEELSSLSKINIDSAKDKLIQILSNYSAIIDVEIMLVFDGHKLKGNNGDSSIKENITVIHTKEGQSADNYIEYFTNSNKDKFDMTVVSSDGLIQQITRGQNCHIVSSREFYSLIETATKELRDNYNL